MKAFGSSSIRLSVVAADWGVLVEEADEDIMEV
jgi:hypothetical protein